MSRTLFATILILSAVSPAQRLTRYATEEVQLLGSLIQEVNQNGWVLQSSSTRPWLSRPGSAPTSLDPFLHIRDFVGALGPFQDALGTFRPNSFSIRGLQVDVLTGQRVSWGQGTTDSILTAWGQLLDGTIICEADEPGNRRDMVMLRSAGGALTPITFPPVNGATYGFRIAAFGEGPVIGLNGAMFPGGSPSNRVWRAGVVENIPSPWVVVQENTFVPNGVLPGGELLVEDQSLDLFGIYDGNQVRPVPSQSSTGTRLDWCNGVSTEGRVFGSNPNSTSHFVYTASSGIVARLDALIDDRTVTDLGFKILTSKRGSERIVVGLATRTLPSIGQVQTGLILTPTTPCVALQIDGAGVTFAGRTRQIATQTTVDLTVLGVEPGQPAAIVAVDPLTQIPVDVVTWGFADATGTAGFRLQVPPVLSGLRCQLQALALDSQFGVLDSPVRIVEVQ